MRPSLLVLLAIPLLSTARAADAMSSQERADRFLSLVNASYQALYYVESQAVWKAATDVTDAHDAASTAASKARAAFMGNPALIEETRQLLRLRGDLNDLSVRQLERLLLSAAESPMTNPQLTAARIEAETAQSSILNSFEFKLAGKVVTANEIDKLLNTSTDLAERRAVWEASKTSGPALRDGLVKLRDLRNSVAREMGHADYFSLQVAHYGLSTEEMLKLNDDFMVVLEPLYAQLHTWTKYKLAGRYKQPVPKLIPAHWINNRWAQEWPGLAEGTDLGPMLKDRTPEWIVKTAESFYTGMGFEKMPASFWTKSDLYPVPKGGRKKNTHASAWHLDLDSDIRSLMSIEPDPRWFTTAHHELGHVYYFMSYTRPEVPPLLRGGANPGFHEGFGELTGLASAQVPYLKAVGVLPADFKADETAFLLNDALDGGIPFIYWSSGVMTHWEADIYARNLPATEWNTRWWKYVREFQGIEPPAERGEEFCDAATKTHINDNPAYYCNYAFAQVFKYQLHDYIARKILKQPPQSCSYANNKEVGDFIRKIMAQGMTGDWRKILRDATGEDLSTRAMVEYYAPLLKWLEKENAGRPIGWK
ncbi:M2 family metallopeptidase [Luteolibacter sp. Populi]|uniref:M2 family metallopeptidase n=1 Tax=Luteolibacter sp. Populi TaxID=3230487 RepID=UPI0034679998